MLLVLDTNVLLRLVEPEHERHRAAVGAVDALDALGHTKAILPQIVYEFWAVATRPINARGLGLTGAEVHSKLEGILATARLLRDERRIYERWRELVADHDVKGKQVHDARIVAAMLRHNISHLLTFNAPDFARYSDIIVVEPHRVGDLPPAQ
jgi:predicted nucleic acid-binding protein